MSTKSLIIKFISDTKDLQKDLDKVGGKLGGVLGTVAKFAAIGGVAAGFKQLITVGNEYSGNLNELQAVTRATNEQMKAVANTAKALGGDLSLPATSAADAAAAMLELSKGGLSVADAMTAAKGTLQLAAAAQIDAATAAEIQSKALNMFGLSAGDAGKVADVLANTANAASGSILDVANSMKYVGPVARSLKVDIVATAGAIGVLANNGIQSEQAGTSLRAILSSLASPSKAASAALKELNVTAFDSQGKFVGLRSIVDQLSSAKGRLTDQTFQNNLANAFGNESLSAANALASSGVKAFDDMAKAVGTAGGASEVAAAKTRGLGGAWEGFKSQLETVAITIYESISPALEGMTRGGAESLAQLGEWVTATAIPALQALGTEVWSHVGPALQALWKLAVDVSQLMQGPLKVALTAIIGSFLIAVDAIKGVATWMEQNRVFAAALAGALTGLLVAISVIKGVTIAMGILNAVMNMNPFVLIITVVAALVGAFIYLWNTSAAFRGFFIGIWDAIKAAVAFTWNSILKPVFDAFAAAFHAVADALTWFWTVVLQPTFTVIGTILRYVGAIVAVVLVLPFVIGFKVMAAILTWFWTNVLAPTFRLIGDIFTWIYTWIIKPIIDGAILYFKVWAATITWFWQTVVQPIFNLIGVIIGWLWNVIIKPTFGLIGEAFRILGLAFQIIWDTIIRPVWDALGNGIRWVWDNVIKPVFNWISDGVSKVGDSFDNATKFIKRVWEKMLDIVRTPVGAVIDFINKFVIHSINSITGIFGVPPIPDIPHFADGGPLHGPGGPRSDKLIIAASPGEYMMDAQSTRRGNNFAALEAMRNGSLTFYAGGGPIVSPVGGPEAHRGDPGSSNLITAAGDLFALGRGILADGAAALLNPLVGQLRGVVGGNKFGDIMVGSLKYIVDKALGWVRGKEADMMKSGAGIGGAGVQRWSGLVLQALSMLGLPGTILPKVLRRMNQESGGNPNIVNNWDSNAAAGHPSMGLMQTIGPTFDANAGPLRGLGILNPLANIYAGLNYAGRRYGAAHGGFLGGVIYGMDKPGGYWSGGMVPGPTGQGRLALVHGGEQVLTASQVQASRKAGGVMTRGGNTYHVQFNITTQDVDEDKLREWWNKLEALDLETA